MASTIEYDPHLLSGVLKLGGFKFEDLPIISKNYERAAEMHNQCRKKEINGSESHKSAADIFMDSGYIGSFKAEKNLSINYKEKLIKGLERKHLKYLNFT